MAPTNPHSMKARIVRVHEWSSDTKSFYLRPEHHVPFIPGQFVMVGLMLNGKLEKRAYSLCNNPDDETLEITFKMYSQGKLSPALFKLKEGDELILEGPYGNFRLDMQDQKAVLIAGGTGIAPLMSMIRLNQTHSLPMRLTLIYSAPNAGRIIYREELEKLAHQNHITLIQLTQDHADTRYLHGRINEVFLKAHVTDLDQTFYLCGSPKMISEIEVALRSLGVDKSRIKTDKWD